jgi:hypothetical protein
MGTQLFNTPLYIKHMRLQVNGSVNMKVIPCSLVKTYKFFGRKNDSMCFYSRKQKASLKRCNIPTKMQGVKPLTALISINAG